MALFPSPENLRAEIARHMLLQKDLALLIGMRNGLMSDYLTGKRPMRGWAAHNIGWGINTMTERRMMDVDMDKGILPAPKGRRPGYQKRRRS